MKFKLILTLFLIVIVSINFGEAQEKRSIAVITLKACEGISLGEADILTSRLNSELIATNSFSVMEREQIDNIFNEG